MFILTSHNKIDKLDKQTGWYLPEVAHPYHVWKTNNIKIDFVSPQGGKTPIDEGSIKAFEKDAICTEFLADKEAEEGYTNTRTIAQVNLSDYAAVFFPGGHGPMYDLAEQQEIGAKVGQYFEKGGLVAAVCHGPAGLVPVKLSSGESIVKGKKVTSFSNKEEDAVGLSPAMPFMLESKLKELGGEFSAAELWQAHVVVDGRLVTGQNPASSSQLAQEVLKLV
uniref:DJ-1/PfpI domain-containing protein n=1 Tax=Arcella intermedia TaxID=1963864 RepID=A0A6B2LH03_9EUKA